ncbi:ATP-dependent RNA helicase vasa-like isoform X2 [Rhizophagus clarus]|uniref:ATP-dependent RNA helicase vasa-like isoform X2 n=1 Tax=Rhizophagus clarus TaxID=94130 RepID=A0A8H3LIC8_9GLOM|nr:ATP-dependent RNA helicase vasa-like isoform X2 [Rhizophagus clarus]
MPNWMKDLNPQEQSILELVAKAKEYFDRSAEPRETRLVDFPEFKGGNQDPLNQWKHQLRNRKQKPGETIENYIAAIEELWKRVDPQGRRTELDKIHEFIEGLRPEFIVPVQSAMPETAEEAMDRTRALETALSLNMELSVYSLIPVYLQNMNGGMIPAKTNMAMFQPTYTATQQAESIEKIVERKISEGIAAALGQIRTEPKPYQNNQGRNSGCYLCGKPGHIAKNCRQRSFQNNGNNSNNNNNNQRNNNNNRQNVKCYNCRRKGHVSKDCKALARQN